MRANAHAAHEAPEAPRQRRPAARGARGAPPAMMQVNARLPRARSRMGSLSRSAAPLTMKILLAADGSEYTRKAARQLVKYTKFLAEPPEIHLLHVHAALPYKRAIAVVGKAAVEKYQREESQAALKVAEKELDKSGLAYTSTWMAGDVAEQIAEFVKRHGIELVVMGSHGNTALKSLTLGSASTRVIALLKVPVLIVR